MENRGLYIHIPFCNKKCYYCDFTTRKNRMEQQEEYVKLLLHEIALYPQDLMFHTIYVGGGTPSLLTASLFETLISRIYEHFVCEIEEFTVECNLEELTDEKLSVYKEVGVNRISLGVQSFEPKVLHYMGRTHTIDDIYRCVEQIKKFGFHNISFDLIFGFENQIDFTKDFENIKKLNPQHISWYNLLIESGTRLYHAFQNGLISENEDKDYFNYLQITQELKEMGYQQYEISNYAKQGYQSMHNLKYWTNHEYLGIGIAASSYLHRYRMTNEKSYQRYKNCIENHQLAYQEKEYIDRMALQFEYIIMHMRIKSGINLHEFYKKFRYNFFEWNKKLLEEYIHQGLIKYDNDHIFFTTRGFFVSNHFFKDLRLKDLTN